MLSTRKRPRIESDSSEDEETSKPKIKNGTQYEGEKSLNTQSSIDMCEKQLKEIPDSPKEVKDFIRDETFLHYLRHCDFQSLSSILYCTKVISEEQLDKLQNSNKREAADTFYTILVGDPGAEKLRKLAQVLIAESDGHGCHKRLAQYIETRFPAKGACKNQEKDKVQASRRILDNIYKLPACEDSWMPPIDHECHGLELLPAQFIEVKQSDIKNFKENLEAEKEPIQYADLLSSFDSQKIAMLIEGEPGIGKTLFTKKLCKDFAEGRIRHTFTMVIRVVLKVLKDTPLELRSLIHSCTADVNYSLAPEEVTLIDSAIRESFGEGVLFIFDGFDELSRELQENSLSMITKIITSKEYTCRESSFIVTSRPVASYAVCKHQTISKKIKIIGLDESNQSQLVATYGNQKFEFAPLYKSVCKNPFYLKLLCIVHRFSASENIPHLSNLKTEIIINVVPFVIQRYLCKSKGKNDPEDFIRSLEDICNHKEVGSQFVRLCNLALKEIASGSSSLSEKDFSLQDGLDFVSCLVYKFIGMEQSFYFVHDIFKELFAAYALVCLPQQGFVELANKFIEREFIFHCRDKCFYFGDIQSMSSSVFEFYCGLGGLSNAAVQENLLRGLKQSYGTVSTMSDESALYYLCKLYKENQSKFPDVLYSKIVEETGPEWFIDTSVFHNPLFNDAELFLLHFINYPPKHCDHNVTGLRFKKISIHCLIEFLPKLKVAISSLILEEIVDMNDDLIEELTEKIEALNCGLSTLKVLDCKVKNVLEQLQDSDSVSEVQSMDSEATNSNIEDYNEDYNEDSERSSTSFGSFLDLEADEESEEEDMHSLTSESLTDGFCIIQNILHCQEFISQLVRLSLKPVTPDIVRILSELSQLKYLSLSNGESKIPINYFFDICKIKLETLKLKSIQFDLQSSSKAVDIDQITQSASCLESLKHLTLSGCDTCISKGLLEVPIPLKTLKFTIRNQRELEYVLKHKQRNALLSNMDISNVKPGKQLCQLLDHNCMKGIEVLDFETKSSKESAKTKESFQKFIENTGFLKHVTFWNCDEHITTGIISGVIGNTSIETIELKYCNFSGCGSLLERLGQCLERKGIRRISLASDQAFPVVTFLIHALKGHRNLIHDPEEEKKELTEVEIECTTTKVCEGNYQDLCRMIPKVVAENLTLEILIVFAGECYSDLAKSVLRGALENKTLKYLKLKMHDKSLVKLIEEVRTKRPQLRLDIENTSF